MKPQEGGKTDVSEDLDNSQPPREKCKKKQIKNRKKKCICICLAPPRPKHPFGACAWEELCKGGTRSCHMRERGKYYIAPLLHVCKAPCPALYPLSQGAWPRTPRWGPRCLSNAKQRPSSRASPDYMSSTRTRRVPSVCRRG